MSSSTPLANDSTTPRKSLLEILNTNTAKLLSHLRPPAGHQTSPDSPVTLVCLSNTHNARPALPSGDILLHAGSLTAHGTFDELQDQLDWLAAQPHAHKLVVPGPHDVLLDDDFLAAKPYRALPPGEPRSNAHLRWGGVVCLDGAERQVTVRGRSVRVYGAPWTPGDGRRAFQHESGRNVWDCRVAEGVDVVVAQCPPKGHLDSADGDVDGSGVGAGDLGLLEEVRRVKPKLVVCGQIHDGRGVKEVVFDGWQHAYDECVGSRKTQLFAVPRLCWAVLAAWASWLFSTSPAPTKIVNASITDYEKEHEDHDAVAVVHL